MRLPFCIGLTGGVGSGKTSAARIFQELGAAVVDTDEIAHDLTRPGGAAVAAIRSEFGADYVAADGGLDRAKIPHSGDHASPPARSPPSDHCRGAKCGTGA